MAKHLSFPTLSLTDAATGKRVRITHLEPGAALVPVPEPVPILGYTYTRDGLTVYVNGSMPLEMRSAAEQGQTDQEAWLVDVLPTGIREITLADHRREFRLLRKAA